MLPMLILQLKSRLFALILCVNKVLSKFFTLHLKCRLFLLTSLPRSQQSLYSLILPPAAPVATAIEASLRLSTTSYLGKATGARCAKTVGIKQRKSAPLQGRQQGGNGSR